MKSNKFNTVLRTSQCTILEKLHVYVPNTLLLYVVVCGRNLVLLNLFILFIYFFTGYEHWFSWNSKLFQRLKKVSFRYYGNVNMNGKLVTFYFQNTGLTLIFIKEQYNGITRNSGWYLWDMDRGGQGIRGWNFPIHQEQIRQRCHES